MLSFSTKCIASLAEIISEKCGLAVFQSFCYLLLNWFYRSSNSFSQYASQVLYVYQYSTVDEYCEKLLLICF